MWATFDDIEKQKKGTNVVVAPIQDLIANDPSGFHKSIRTGKITEVVDNNEICIELNKDNDNDYTSVSYHPTKRYVFELADSNRCFMIDEVLWNDELPFRKQGAVGAYVLLSNFKVGAVCAIHKSFFEVEFYVNKGKQSVTKSFFESGMCVNTPTLRVLRNLSTKEVEDITKNGGKVRAKFLYRVAAIWYNHLVDSSWFSDTIWQHNGKECTVLNECIASDVPYVAWVQFDGVKGKFKVPAHMLEYIVDKDLETCNNEIVVKKSITKSKEDKKMKSMENYVEEATPKTSVIEDVKSKAKADAVFIAKMTAGKTALKKITKWYVTKSPIIARGYAETYSPFINLGVASGLAIALKRFFPDDPRTNFACESLEMAALADVSEMGADFLVEILDMFPVPELMKSTPAKKPGKKLTLNEAE